MGFLRDGFRLLGALIYWNCRKSIYVTLGRKGRAPCQNSSDDEVVGCIGCDAVLHWENAKSFRRVCPLLIQKEEGWRCSVLSDKVRPYWLAALKWYGVLLLTLYLIGGVFVWGGMKLVGEAQVPLVKVWWPGSWSDVAEIQSEALYRQCRVDFAFGNYRRAYRSLESARRRDPHNYSAALLMAKIQMFQGGYLYADDQYSLLMDSHPEHWELTIVNYHDALLSLNRMDRLAEHCLEMVRLDSSHAALWVKSLLLALRSPEVAQARHASAVESLPGFARILVRAQILASLGNPEAARAILSEPFRGPWNREYIQEQIAILLRLGASSEVATLLGYYGPGLLIDESMAQQYLINSARSDGLGAQSDFLSLLRKSLNAQRILRLQLLLIREPNRECYLQLHRMLKADPLLKNQTNDAVMWVTGLVSDAHTEAYLWRGADYVISGGELPVINHLDFQSTRLDQPDSVLHVINTVDFPREVVWELLNRVNRNVTGK